MSTLILAVLSWTGCGLALGLLLGNFMAGRR
jgi:hypothetical protein